MNISVKYFVSMPVFNWKRMLAKVKAELADFRKVDQAIMLQQEAYDQRMRLNMMLSAPKM